MPLHASRAIISWRLCDTYRVILYYLAKIGVQSKTFLVA
jgi:hypothetical protein